MQKQPEIVFRNVQYSEAVEAAIRERIDKLAARHEDIVGVTVTVQSPNRHGHKGRRYAIGIDLSVRGGELVVNRGPQDDGAHEDVFVAVRDAFDALERQLVKHDQKRRRDVKTHDGVAQGRVERLFEGEGFGFIGTPDGRHIYFHHNAVLDGFETLELGDPVQYVEEVGDDGPQASTVRRIGPWRALYAGPRS